MRVPVFLLTALVGLLVSCGEDAATRTQVLLLIDGGAQVRADATRLEVAFRSGEQTERDAWEAKKSESFVDFTWPASLALLPAESGNRGFEVEITAYQGTERLVQNRVISAFVSGRTLLLEVVLDDLCIGEFMCGQAETCRAQDGKATCETAVVNPKSLPEYKGGKVRDDLADGGPVTRPDDGGPAEQPKEDGGPAEQPGEDGGSPESDAGRDAGPATPCVPSGAEACFNGKDDDCNGVSDCADEACQVEAMCVPGDTAAGVLVGKDEACPEGFEAKETVIHRGLSGGGCVGCSCSVTDTTCTASVYVYAQDFSNEGNECSNDVYNQGGELREVSLLLNDWTHANDNRTCPTPIQDGTVDGWRTTTIVPTDGACAPRGSAEPEPATWAKDAKLCQPKALGAGCGDAQVCVPRTEKARVCGVVSDSNRCIGGSTAWYEGYEDQRTCGSCRCTDGAGGNCNGVRVQFGSDWGCNVNTGSTGMNERACTSVYSPPAFLTGTPVNKTCIPSASTSGALTPTGRLDLCCTDL